MKRIFKDYIYQRFVEDIIIYSYGPLLIASLFAARLPFDWPLVAAIGVNYFMYLFSFIYNDIEDRVEDANSPGKRFKNPFGYKVWTLGQGYLILGVLALISLTVSFWIGDWVLFWVAASNLLFGIIYSAKALRLKNIAIIDILSHGYLLGSVQILYFMLMPGAVIDGWTWLIFIGVTIAAIGGDLINEARDFEDDRAAGLRNTAHYIGFKATDVGGKVLYGSGVAMVFVGAIAALINAWPA